MNNKQLFFICLILLLALSGCASMEPSRRAQFLSENYTNQVKKSITVVSLVDARPDKTGDTQQLLSNRNVRQYFISNALSRKGYSSKLIDTDTSKCGPLSGVNNIEEISCLDTKIFQDGEIFLLISIDDYTAPKGARVAGDTKVTGVLYSKSLNSFIWKDSFGGNYAGIGIQAGPGGYVGMLTLKMISSDLIFRNNTFNTISKLLESLPPYQKSKK